MFARILLITALALVLWATFARETGASGPERVYLVRGGDSLWSIALANYAGDPREAVWRVQERNGLVGTTIRPGQRLVLP